MDEFKRLIEKLPFPPIFGLLFGGVATVLVAATPYWLFVKLVVASGLPAVLPEAQPPLGDTARIAAMGAAGFGTFLLGWLIAGIGERLFGSRKRKGGGVKRNHAKTGTSLRSSRTQARRAPLFAGQDLGAPLMSDAAIEQAREELLLDSPMSTGAQVARAPLFAREDHGAPLMPSQAIAQADEEVPHVPQRAAALTMVEPGFVAPAVAPFVPKQGPFEAEVEATVARITPSHAPLPTSISCLIDRLDRALAMRAAQGSPYGDIVALRQALGVSGQRG